MGYNVDVKSNEELDEIKSKLQPQQIKYVDNLVSTIDDTEIETLSEMKIDQLVSKLDLGEASSSSDVQLAVKLLVGEISLRAHDSKKRKDDDSQIGQNPQEVEEETKKSE